MYCKRIEYTDFRNIIKEELEFTEGINVIHGENAQGKTNILEGIYIFARGKSFRAFKDRELIRFGYDSAYAKIEFETINRLEGTNIPLSFPSVGATENILLAACTAKGETLIVNAAREPEIQNLADYLLENGVIVPPCKVGQTVYCIVEGFDVVMEGHIRQLIVAEGIFVDCVIRGYFNQVFHSSKIGKTVFLTKEEAEQALKGGGQE